MRNKKRRSAQRRINKYFREWNRRLQEDELWRGRFQVGQFATFWNNFSDGTGDGFLYIQGVVYDKKNRNFCVFLSDEYFAHEDIGKAINDFITFKSGVWNNIEEVKRDKTDWSKVVWHP